MNILNRTNMQNSNQLKARLNDPQFRSQVQQMYAVWKGDPQGFISSLMQNNPQLKNNQLLQSVLSGQANPQQVFNQILGQCGLSVNDIMSLLK
jgi:hypothetical protein